MNRARFAEHNIRARRARRWMIALIWATTSLAFAAEGAAVRPPDLNGTWSGPAPEFTDDGIPLFAITRNVPWAPFSSGLPEARKAPSREQQLQQREDMLKFIRAANVTGANIFAGSGPLGALSGGGPDRPNPLLTDAGAAALKAARASAVSNKIAPSDVNSLLRCYPQNRVGLGSPVTIIQGPEAIAFFNGTHTRVVYLDGRSFDTAPVPDYAGYSIGHWEGQVLVVETRGFRGPTLQLMPLGQLPLSPTARITEYIGKIEGGKTLQVRTVIEDSAYLKEKIGAIEYQSWAPEEVPVDEDCVEGLAGQIDYDVTKFKAQ